MVESAPAVTYGAPYMTQFPHPLVAPAVTYMAEAASVAPAPSVTYGAPPVVTSSGPYAVTYSQQPQVAPAVTYMGAAPVALALAFTYSTGPQVSPARDLTSVRIDRNVVSSTCPKRDLLNMTLDAHS